MTTEEKAKAYDEAIKKAESLYKIAEPMSGCNVILETLFPELKESEGEKIRKDIIRVFKGEISFTTEEDNKKYIAWLEKQGEQSNNEEAEKEKNDYVSGQFLYCKGSFNEFREGESYWLEYVGNDNYIGRSDNILNQKFHITPRQLYTWLDPRHAYNGNETNAPTEYGKYVEKCLNDAINHYFSEGEDKYSDADLFYAGVRCGINWLEKQGEKDSQVICPTFTFDDILALQCCMETVKKVQEDKDLYKKLNDLHGRVYDAYHFEKQGKQETIDKVEPKFKAGDWITNGRYIRLIVGINSDCPYYMFKDGTSKRIKDIDEKYHLWTIEDARDGDVLVTNFEEDNIILMYHSRCTIDTINVHCCLDNKFTCANLGVFDVEDVHPATKEQRNLLFTKMKEAGYEWDSDKKELKKIEQKFDSFCREHCKGFQQTGKCFADGDCKAKREALSMEIPFGAYDSELQEASYYIPKGFHAEIEGNKVIIKKGEQKQDPYNGVSFEYNDHIWGMCARDYGVDISCDHHLIGHLGNQGEQRLSDKEMKILLRTEYEKGRADVIAETQKEWSRDDEQYLLVCKNALAKYQTTNKWDAGIISRWLEDKIKSTKFQSDQKWSEEDKNMLDDRSVTQADLDSHNAHI